MPGPLLVPRATALGLALLLACTAPETPRPYALISSGAGEVRVEVELAESDADRLRGLMGRTSLAPDAGMAFLWSEDTTSSFHMRDTLIPLSVAFWDADGVIRVILHMEPCAADPCPTHDPRISYRGALEVNAGAFERWGVRVGDRVRVVR